MENDDIQGRTEPPSPDWWQASDDLWYPPETHPDATGPVAPPNPTMPAQPPPPTPSSVQGHTTPGWQQGPPTPGYPPQAQWTVPPKAKGTNPLVIILAIIGGLFVLMLGGCAVAGLVFARSSGEVFQEFEEFNGIEIINCELALEEAVTFANRDDQLAAIDRAIRNCGTVENFRDAIGSHPELLELGQTVDELLDDRCATDDIGLAVTRICTEVDELN